MNANCPVAGRAVAEPDSEAAVRFRICRHCTWEMTGDSEDENANIYC